MEYDQKQLAYELHRPKRKHFHTIPVVVKAPHESWQADLVDMSHLKRWNGGSTFLLTVIDTFSKMAYARAFQSKKGIDVTPAFESILEESGRAPKHLQTDQGTEYFNSTFRALMKKYGINHYHTFSDKKSSIVERFNRTLKTRMYRYFTEANTLKWRDVLQKKLIHDYNRTKHRTIQMKPVEVTEKNAKAVHQNILLASRRKKTDSSRRRHFQVGDVVRLSRVKGTFAKGYTENWTEELFKVSAIQMTQPRTYKVEDLLGVPVKGTFYAQELQKTKVPDYARIEKVISRKTLPKGRK